MGLRLCSAALDGRHLRSMCLRICRVPTRPAVGGCGFSRLSVNFRPDFLASWSWHLSRLCTAMSLLAGRPRLPTNFSSQNPATDVYSKLFAERSFHGHFIHFRKRSRRPNGEVLHHESIHLMLRSISPGCMVRPQMAVTLTSSHAAGFHKTHCLNPFRSEPTLFRFT